MCIVIMPRVTLLDLLAERQSGEAPFLVYNDGYRTWTFSPRQVAEGAAAFALRLRKAGILPGDKVILWGENRPGWILALWGCLLEGAVAVPIDYRSSAAFVEKVRGIVAGRVVVTGDEVAPVKDAWTFEEVEAARSVPGVSGHRPGREEIAEILFTSGATAEPKGVLISHRNLLANLVPVETEVKKYRAHWSVHWLGEPLLFPVRFLNLLPLSHLFGQTMAAFIPPMIDGEVHFSRSQSPADIVSLMKRRRISVLVCVPKMMDLLREHVVRLHPEAAEPMPPGPGGSLSFLRNWWKYRRIHRRFGWKFWCLIVGAAPLDPELEAFWRKLGYVVIQGYGLTETAPIVSINHPFQASHGTVGRPVAGVEVKLAADGEILVRGENVTSGYYGTGKGVIAEDGWFHTGDVGEMDATGAIRIRGRKKEMIVTPEGLNVFPDDLERALLGVEGVEDAAVVEHVGRPHAVLVLRAGLEGGTILRQVNARLEEHQRIRAFSLWPAGETLPRTEGTKKLKRMAIAEWVRTGQREAPRGETADVAAVLGRYAGGRAVSETMTIDELGLSSLERVQLLMDLEEKLGRSLDETAFTEARTVADLRRLETAPAAAAEPIEFARWARSPWARAIRRISLPTWILPLARVFLWIRTGGIEKAAAVQGPVIFASNHQSYMDTPAILAALPGRWRYWTAPAMRKEFFDAHFHAERHPSAKRLRNSLGYYLSCLMFHAFPLPQREAGTRQALQYAGELVSAGYSILIFPEGKHSEDDTVGLFHSGVSMMADRLRVPVVPVRLRGVNRVLHPHSRLAKPGRVEVVFGAPLVMEADEEYGTFAARVEAAVKNL